jgi:hypothetical protein
MKKLFGILMLMIIGLSGTAYAEDFQINKGWNLISGTVLLNLYNELEIESVNKNTFYLNPYNKKYETLNEIQSSDFFEDFNSDDNFILNSGLWYYSENYYNFKEDISSFEGPIENPYKLKKGWNQISISSNWIYDSNSNHEPLNLAQIKGSCSIEKMYIFEHVSQEWHNLELNSFELYQEFFGMGMAIKILDDCSLNYERENTNSINPPALPSN